MKYFFALIVLGGLITSELSADCVTGQYGKVICGKGQCETDIYGKVFCAQAGGGAMKDKFGIVQCGTGYCEKDYEGHVLCSQEPGGGASLDTYGNVKCLGGCEAGSSERCQEAR